MLKEKTIDNVCSEMYDYVRKFFSDAHLFSDDFSYSLVRFLCDLLYEKMKEPIEDKYGHQRDMKHAIHEGLKKAFSDIKRLCGLYHFNWGIGHDIDRVKFE